MATYSLSGTGVQALSANVTAVHVTITTLPLLAGQGTGNPTNYYHVAMLRFGDATGYFDAIPVVGGPQWLAVPSGTTRLGYSCQSGAAISVAEVIGGVPPFGGGGALSGLSDVALSSPADTQVLTYQASSSKWINASGGGGGLTLIASQILASATASVTFSSIPGAYKDLVLRYVGRSDYSGGPVVGVDLRCNGDTAANYAYAYVRTTGAVISSTGTFAEIGNTTAGTATANRPGSGEIIFENYTDTHWHKSGLAHVVDTHNVGAYVGGWLWASTAAITSITLLLGAGNWITNSRFDLWGR